MPENRSWAPLCGVLTGKFPRAKMQTSKGECHYLYPKGRSTCARFYPSSSSHRHDHNPILLHRASRTCTHSNLYSRTYPNAHPVGSDR